MTRAGPQVRLLTRWRVVATSATTAVRALLNLVRGGAEAGDVELRAGDEAPEFSLVASDGRRYRLSEFRRRQPVVLAWFPKAFTGGCTIQCESIGAHSGRFRDIGAAVFGANVDTPDTNKAFSAALGLDFPILSDPDQSTARAYGVLGASGFPSRWTFYIGMDGRILSVDKEVHVSTNGSDIENTLGKLQIPRQA
jgi:peroxiredoxin Q/BCP